MMPLVNDLLTELEGYQWFCSLDAASGFWLIMMTERARHLSAFVCSLGHFKWLRIPFGLKNAPMIYQPIIEMLCGATFSLKEAGMRFRRMHEMWRKKHRTDNRY